MRNSVKIANIRAKQAIVLVVALFAILSLAFSYAAITDIIMLRKTEDMVGSENAISILFVGNSQIFVGDLPRQLQTVARAQDVEIIYKDISRHGNRGGSLGELRGNAIREMQSGRFDYVILHDNSWRVVNNPDDFLHDAQYLSNIARENGVVPVLFSPAGWKTNDGQPDEECYRITAEAYQRAADENDVILVKAGDAWVYAYKTIPEISLYTRFDPRGPHHPGNAGGFLTACVFAATLFDLRIEDIPKDSRYRGSDAALLAQAAWEFVHPSTTGDSIPI